jgi:zinc-finger-containing domain
MGKRDNRNNQRKAKYSSVAIQKLNREREKIREREKEKRMASAPDHPGECQHCGGEPEYKPSSAHVHHGRDNGPVWECDCGARVNCHAGTSKPLGTVADRRTRRMRMLAHDHFDRLWHQFRLFGDRMAAYQWLRAKMGLCQEECHIGMMGFVQCERVIALCEEHRRKCGK